MGVGLPVPVPVPVQYVTDPRSFTPEQFGDAAKTLGAWLASGELQDQTTVMEGFDHIPTAILGLFSVRFTCVAFRVFRLFEAKNCLGFLDDSEVAAFCGDAGGEHGQDASARRAAC